jgi:selenium metabolism protein YedF
VTETVDARGLPCPQPVILTRNALQGNDAVVTVVDNEIAQRNVTRMAEQVGGVVKVEQHDDGIYLHITMAAAPSAGPAPPTAASAGGPLVLVIPGEFMGRGEHPELGQVLLRGFFHTLSEVAPLPDAVIFFNSGVKLVTEGSPIVEDLEALRGHGVEILVCGTCLQYYGLTERVAVGEVSNMYTIAETILGAGRMVSL